LSEGAEAKKSLGRKGVAHTPSGDAQAGGFDGPSAYLAAVTVRINSYTSRRGRWAQILNMSVARERQGYGTILIAGLEELFRWEDIDVAVLYPAENGRAPAFWSSIGFSARQESLLPEDELIPLNQGGPLLPEFDPCTSLVLPRWEKRLFRPRSTDSEAHVPVVYLSGSKKHLTSRAGTNRRRGRGRGGQHGHDSLVSAAVAEFRELPASASRLSGALLQAAANALKEQRRQVALKVSAFSDVPLCV